MNLNIPKSNKYYIEKYLPSVLGIICGGCFIFIALKNEINYEVIKNIIFSFPAIGFTIFGFCFTLLTLLIQGNSEFLINLRTKKIILFNRIICKNKDIVYYSFFLSVYSFILNMLYPLLFILITKYIGFEFYKILKIISISIFIIITIRLYVALFYFLKIFYLVIKQK